MNNYLQDSDLKIFAFLKELNNFKLMERLSVIKEAGRRESDAEHTWHLIMFVWLYSYSYDHPINLLKAIKIALVHDLVEIYAGDVYDVGKTNNPDLKKTNEIEAAKELFNQLPKDIGKEFFELWNEYEECESEESKYVWAFDKICPRFQLSITKKDLSEGLPVDLEKKQLQEEKISNISQTLKKVLSQCNI